MTDAYKHITPLSPEKRKYSSQSLRKEGADVSTLQILPQSRKSNIFPLSFSQQGWWFIHQLNPDDTTYNETGAFRLKGQLNNNVLEQTINEILRRHEVLRTSFTQSDGQPIQVIHPAMELSLRLIDLSKNTESEREAEIQRIAKQQAYQPFDLTLGPLIRYVLLRLGERDHVLMMTIHYIVFDVWSTSILLREMATLYEAFSSGKASPLPELPIQYVDFAVWQRQWLQGEFLEKLLSYWKQKLTGLLPVLELPTDRPRPSVLNIQGAN
ncbi:MAG TPA: condensation domain-containing protein, partial [Thermodesulfobacteriota bacterium]